LFPAVAVEGWLVALDVGCLAPTVPLVSAEDAGCAPVVAPAGWAAGSVAAWGLAEVAPALLVVETLFSLLTFLTLVTFLVLV
jgi:hypothetical protein